ncbi:MAG TPA: hypothetical protein VKW09_04850 [bacterium]|nr:hypothetical protein [bacterium]
MPRQVFADEIERFLATLDGVSSARVLTGPDGDVSFVYVTTDSASDSRALRGGVVAALQAHFGIPIDEWRVRITQLRAGAQASVIPHFRVARVEEAAAGTDLAVTVTLRWRQGADERTAVGKARSRAGATGRARALAAATIAAVRDALEIPHAELALERVGTVTFLDRPVILVAVSCGAAGETRTLVGAAFDEPVLDPASEPATAAALDAATRWFLYAAFAAEAGGSRERRDRLEAMRHFVLDAAADPATRPGPAEPAPRMAPGAPEPAAETVESMRAAGTAPPIEPVRALPPRRAGMMRDGGRVSAPFLSAAGRPASGGSPAPRAYSAAPVELAAHADAQRRAVELAAAARQMGSRTKEETEMGLQHETPEAGSGTRAGRTPSVEDVFYRSLVAERTPVHLRCRDGYEVPRAIVRDAGTYALLIETEEGLELFFKHAIISIRVLPKRAPQA